MIIVVISEFADILLQERGNGKYISYIVETTNEKDNISICTKQSKMRAVDTKMYMLRENLKRLVRLVLKKKIYQFRTKECKLKSGKQWTRVSEGG